MLKYTRLCLFLITVSRIIFTYFPQTLWWCSFFPAPYIKPCARSDPNFNECALEHAKDVYPQLVKGKISFYSVFVSRPSCVIAKSLFIWENKKADIASQVPDFERSKKVRALDHVVTWRAGSFFYRNVVWEVHIYIHTKVAELKKFIDKELQIKVRLWITKPVDFSTISYSNFDVRWHVIQMWPVFFFYSKAIAKTFDVKLWHSNEVSSNT